MSESIYVVDPRTKQSVKVAAVAFSEVGLKERGDLQKWVSGQPDLLGEPLLFITEEYDRFDKSDRRLDILALDEDGMLVVVELKLDIAGSLADQQAIRYAAFCSNMTMEDVLEAFSERHGCSKEEAADRIRTFLKADDLPQLQRQPRIILAAGSVDDQELTSCVLWLRKFGVDITCVELTPYRMPQSQDIVLVPKVIIPLPEARDYVIGAERKEVERIHHEQKLTALGALWRTVAGEFNKLGLPFEVAGRNRTRHYMKVPIGHSDIHYEWGVRKSEHCIDVGLHFESKSRDENIGWLDLLTPHKAAITKGIEYPFAAGPWGNHWAKAYFRILYEGDSPDMEAQLEAVSMMKVLIQRTWPLIKHLTKRADVALQ